MLQSIKITDFSPYFIKTIRLILLLARIISVPHNVKNPRKWYFKRTLFKQVSLHSYALMSAFEGAWYKCCLSENSSWNPRFYAGFLGLFRNSRTLFNKDIIIQIRHKFYDYYSFWKRFPRSHNFRASQRKKSTKFYFIKFFNFSWYFTFQLIKI